MTATLPDFRQADVLIVGDIMLDRYWYGPTNRISPEAPVPVVKIETIEDRPGGAANVAMNVAILGGHSHLIGLVGIDEAARILKEKLSKANVTCNFIINENNPTIIKLRIFSRNQQLIRLDLEQNFKNIDLKLIVERVRLTLPQVNVLVLSDYAKGSLTCVHEEIIALARSANVPVLVDPKGTNFSHYQGATVLTPNLSEFEAVVGNCKNEKTLIKRGMEMITDYHISALLITRSEKGMILLQSDKEPLQLPTQARRIYDTTGAGDTVIGVLAATLATGSNLEESCFLANAAAGMVVGKLGTSIAKPVDLKNFVCGCAEIKFGIVTEDELKKEVNLVRKQGGKIVMTNGIFDLLHIGHINYLSNARQLGDRLIVAINSDESTKRLKGKTRPINPLMQRMTVLAALEAVDWVVSFNEDTPYRLITDILPDILVKGGDYYPNQIAGYKEVWRNGGRVLMLEFNEGFSTSKIIDTILKQRNGE
ncbi:bifunctional D-glycero-beta-D-manno-heptose-7-phosphate kinase/D-glycero-beta-D-manno-heptose 1-phosphate adenylyltransferase HldE [Sodalis sp. CWE]|uniref:bifunctional D-glycero-beta-D-manno-heptose-7-phosphate kinase/D-glycero-beta-D-manno-heptose 1-phosphate adenylyltransferase HldE n=1 Tax=Sodalis sp. CWE TaxID=2803816 RepID=UPI001C7D2287|nr:bifunctional D-glycero-beta-D-manno-heptose-7-phosphate kinase/D-glycero-beta-D-manno-heptose 1-phosphate adenylyltransferase HldE [Sodalis sp. CWE]MBX4180823.1 bifunctional D-glycero-beta-D-manno-heptose-7-phosphate kinase/D-glycero-beta-D-manno-heptose 1-phosphate adenylyltransferase HldE [Sodalis sp. CWE]